MKPGEIDDGQYREDPNIYLDPKYNSKPSGNKATSTFRIQAQQPATKTQISTPNFNYQTTPVPEIPQYHQSRFQAPVNYQPQQSYYQPQQNYYQPQQNHYQPKSNYNAPQPSNIFAGHPAQNFDIFSGSYTISY